MDYEKFKREFQSFEDYMNDYRSRYDYDGIEVNDDVITDDRVNSPSHYTAGKYEAIDIIEDAIKHAPTNEAGFLQGQVLKYLLRLWLKDNPIEDARKARWYLDRLIDQSDSAR